MTADEGSTNLATERLLLRAWREDDLPAFAALNADPLVMEFMPKRLGQTESDALAERIRALFEQHRFGLWAVEVPGVVSFVGFVGLSVLHFKTHFAPCVEIGWRLAREYWGRGYATEAALRVVAHGFGPLGLTEIVSFTARANTRSRAVMERLGMRHDAADAFDHPALPEAHPLRPHVLYRLRPHARV